MLDNTEIQESLLQCLQNYFDRNNNQNNKGEFQLIENILKSEECKGKGFSIDDVIAAIHEDPSIRFSVRGCKVRPKPLELNSDPIVILSKKMAAVLRHGLNRSGLTIYKGCYVNVDDLLDLSSFKEFTRDDIYKVVNTNGKRRYEIIIDNEIELITALQGHTIPLTNTSLIPVTSVKEFKIGYHGTFYCNWESIKKNGLLKMGRNHIHLYTSDSKETLRDGAEIIIKIDIERAFKDGIKFYKSKNNILLCEGKNGILNIEYFITAWDRNTDAVLFPIAESKWNFCENTQMIKSIKILY